MYLFKKNLFRYFRSIVLSAFFVLFISASSVICCKAATTGTANVMFYLNGATIPGYTDGGLIQGTSGTSISIPAPPSKLGYTFKGWLQYGNSGIGPQGKPVWLDGELVSRPASDLYSTAKVPASITATKIPKPADSQIRVSTTSTRVTWTENAHYGGYYDTLGLVWNNFTIQANSYLRCMLYAKIPVGYVLVPSIGRATTPGTVVLTSASKYTVSPSEFVGTGEYQYYEWIMFNGNGEQDVGLFGLTQIDKSLPQPSASNPVSIDIGYYNYTKCDGSAGHTLGNGVGTYKFDYTSPAVWVQDCLTAIFDPNIYNITYDANGGVGAPSMQSYGYNTTKNINLTNSIPQKTGFTFCGWDTNPNAITPSYKSGYQWSCSNKFNTTLYAIWKLSEMIKIQSPKTIILDHYGIGEFKISASVLYGEIIIDFPSTIYFSSPNKPPIPGNITLSGKCLNKEQNILYGRINVPSLTAGLWNTSFNIHYKYNSK